MEYELKIVRSRNIREILRELFLQYIFIICVYIVDTVFRNVLKCSNIYYTKIVPTYKIVSVS